MQRAGAGALFEQFLRLKAKLASEGLFDADRKKPLPAFARSVGVVTSLGAAALHDVLTALARRAPHVSVVVYPSLVQGAEAPAALVAALARASQRAEVDVLIVCRGGGSLEDLWAFNDERVVRAIAACPLPVVCGVGHETDVSLADFVADLRAPTPTAAAELATPSQQSCLQGLSAWVQRLRGRMHQQLDQHAQRLDRSTHRLARPTDGVRRHTQGLMLLRQRLHSSALALPQRQQYRLADLQSRVSRAVRVMQRAQPTRLDAIEARLRALDPQRVLQRGYAWLSDAQGQPVTSAHALAPGMAVRAVLADGEASATITTVSHPPPQA
jgi:exodeoxyribonuclease VII large subunit